jgi:cytochrome c-type biogenesis protein CcmH
VRRVGALLAVLALTASPAAAAAAARDCPKTSLGDIEDEVMCPVCGTPLGLASEAPQAERERAYIQRLVDSCKSKDQVKRALVAEFGERVLALPGDEGDDDLGDVLVYAVPAVALALAIGGIAAVALRWRRRRPAPADAPSGAASERLDADLERYEL